MLKIHWTVFLPTFMLAGHLAYAENLPQGMSFVGLSNTDWEIYGITKEELNPRVIATMSEPRTPSYHFTNGKVSYISADGSLREQGIDQVNNIALLKSDSRHAYTQPAYSPDGNRLYVVELKEGSSVDTDILVFDETRKNPKRIVKQRSAQFDPFAPTNSDLYYSNVICTVGCGKIIQEIWHMNIVSGEAKQLTLLNSIARQPFVLPDSDWLYFSSNKKGNYHIWRMNMTSNEYEQLTDGYVTDISPVLDKDSNLYFIRRSPHAVQLMLMRPNGELNNLPLPAGVTDLRDLEMIN
jgi:Tol biopolymer transport system component